MSNPSFDSNFKAGLHTSTAGSSTTWSTTIPPGENRQLNKGVEAQYYFDQGGQYDPFSISGGIVTIKASPVPASSNPLSMLYGSGCLTSSPLFSQENGRFEIDCILPQAKGFWPAFWLLPSSLVYTGELDMVEIFGGSPAQFTEHGMNAQNQWVTPEFQFSVPDWSTNFHRLGLMWSKSTCKVTIDDKVVGEEPTLPGIQSGGPMFLIANLAVGLPGSWLGAPAAGACASMSIRSIKAWE